MDQLRFDRVLSALDLLARFEPEAHAHVVREAREIRWEPAWCPPNAIACAGGPLGRRIVLVQDPLSMDIVELASTIFHEGLHLATGPGGRFLTLHHECDACTTFAERASDWIYREEAALEARLRATTGIQKRSSITFGQVFGAVVVAGLAGLAIGTVAASISNSNRG